MGSYSEWYRKIRMDKSEEAEALLVDVSPPVRDLLVNGDFRFEVDSVEKYASNQWVYRPTKALFLAAIHNSFEILKLFHKHGANFSQVDSSGDNIVHSLILMSFDETQKERCILAYKFIIQLVPRQITEKILLMENKDGLRPLELAMQLSSVSFFEEIMDTEPVYKAKVMKMGVQNVCLYDITEYETLEPTSRAAVSPMSFLTHLDENIFDDATVETNMQTSILKTWANNKIKANVPFLVLWCSLRIFHVAMFYISISAGHAELARTSNVSETKTYDNGTQSTTYEQTSDTTNCATYIYYSTSTTIFELSSILLIAFGAVIVLYDLAECFWFVCVHNRQKWKRLERKIQRRRILNYKFYRQVYFSTSASVMR